MFSYFHHNFSQVYTLFSIKIMIYIFLNVLKIKKNQNADTHFIYSIYIYSKIINNIAPPPVDLVADSPQYASFPVDVIVYFLMQVKLINPFMPTVPTFAVRETDVSRHNGGTSGAPLKPLRDDSALRARQSLGQQMLERWA